MNYAKLYTLRKDGRYQGSYKGDDGKFHYVCDRDPERLHQKLEEKKNPTRATFKEMADGWEQKHRDEVKERTWKNYRRHYDDLVEGFGDRYPWTALPPQR